MGSRGSSQRLLMVWGLCPALSWATGSALDAIPHCSLTPGGICPGKLFQEEKEFP